MITFKTGSASIVMRKNGDIEIRGNVFVVGSMTAKAPGEVIIKGTKINN